MFLFLEEATYNPTPPIIEEFIAKPLAPILAEVATSPTEAEVNNSPPSNCPQIKIIKLFTITIYSTLLHINYHINRWNKIHHIAHRHIAHRTQDCVWVLYEKFTLRTPQCINCLCFHRPFTVVAQ